MNNDLKESSYVPPVVEVIPVYPSRVMCDSDPIVGDNEDDW